MGSISTGVGVVSGIDYAQIITQLIALSSRPIQGLDARITAATNQQTALYSITGYLQAIQNLSKAFTDANAFAVRQAATSNRDVLRATAQPGAAVGTYALTVARLVQSHQVVSNGFADDRTTPVGAGVLRFETVQGGLRTDTPLSLLNAQRGVDRGAIRLTDRSGASAVIDLSDCVTVTDVLDRINASTAVDVAATVTGGRLVLTDQTGAANANLSVANVAGGRTATDLGLAQSVAADRLVGADLVALTPDTALARLNDGNGVRIAFGFDDFRISLRDGATIDVSLTNAKTLNDVLLAINTDAENNGSLLARLGADGVSLELVDASVGDGALSVSALNGSSAAADLGLLATAAPGADTLAGDRLVAGLNTVLLRSLAGGAGLVLGQLRLVDRQGAESIVDLAGAQTVQDVIDLINAPEVAAHITAEVNAAGNGLRIIDHTGAQTAPLIVTNYGSSTTATALGLDTTAGGVAAARVEGADLERRYVSEATLLADLNGGQGIVRGKFTITDSNGKAATVDLTQGTETTVGDVLREINSRGLDVIASINATGDGLLLTDVGGGTGRLAVAEVAGGTTAASLGLRGQAAEGQTTIDGSFEIAIQVEAGDTLQTLAAKLNASRAPVTASILSDGTPGAAYRLSLTSRFAGAAGRLLIDPGATGLTTTTLVEGRDATLVVGRSGTGNRPLLITSRSNTLTGVLPNVTLDLVSVSATPVTVSVSSDGDALVKKVSAWVEAVNAALKGIDRLTAYDAETQSTGVLQGDPTAARARAKLTSLVTGRFTGVAGAYAALRDVGISINEKGLLVLDEGRLRTALATNAADVATLFGSAQRGVGAVFDAAMHDYTSPNPGLIENRVKSLSTRIDLLTRQKAQYQVRVDAEQRRLELEFTNLELALSRLKAQQSALAMFGSSSLFSLSASIR
jgi:flagellar hook-associated protein 2